MNYVYKFIDYNNNIIYIGKTENLKRRMSQHFFRGHLDDECYQNVNRIYFCEIEGKTNTEIMETFLINKYRPRFNIDKKYTEDMFRHIDDNVCMTEPFWKELYFDFFDDNIIISDKPIKPAYYNRNLDDKEKCIAIIKHNIGCLQHKRGFYKKYMPGVIELDKMLDYFIVIHKEILENFDVKNSSVDEPVTTDSSSEFVAFKIGAIKTINLQYLMLLSNMQLITHLYDDTYALFVHNEYIMKSIPIIF